MLIKNRILKCCLLIAVLLVLVLLVLAAGSEKAEGKTITVDDDGEGDYEKIQDAVDAAEDGDTIRVYEGTYYENVVVDKTVNLVGNGSTATTVDGGGSGSVVKIKADWCNVSGFKATGSGNELEDGGIKIEANHSHLFENDCSDNGRSGILLDDSFFNVIENNRCENISSRGIYLVDSHSNTVMNNILVNNSYGIDIRSSLFNNIIDNDCSNNTNVGIRVYDCQKINNITNNVCYGNGAWRGISLEHTSKFQLLNNNHCENYEGDGIFLGVLSSNTKIFNNTCSNNKGDGIYISSDFNLVSNNICKNNRHLSNAKAGIRIASNFNTLSHNICENNIYGIMIASEKESNIIRNNSCRNNENGIYFSFDCDSNIIENNNCVNGTYGIYFDKGSSYNSIQNNTITENTDGIFLRESANNVASYNRIYNNRGHGINASENGGKEIDAKRNWWGHATGPYHPTENPDGVGDSITDDVVFKPWLTHFDKRVHNTRTTKRYLLIQTAINDASPGDTIRVYNGTFPENIILNKALNLIGNSSASTTIDGGFEGDVVRITADWCNVSRMRMINGDNGIYLRANHTRVFDTICEYHLDGIYLDSASHNVIENNICEKNSDGVTLFSSSYNFIRNNSCTNSNDAGIELEGSSFNVLENNTCVSNSQGIYLDESDSNSIENTLCEKNSNYGLSLYSSITNTVENDVFENNSKGIYLASSSHSNTIENSSCISNENNGIILENSDFNTIFNSLISGNKIGIYVLYGSQNNAAHYNDIYTNWQEAIKAKESINATYNWWGDESGPYHPTENPEGKGDNVTENVEFNPWLGKKQPPVITTIDKSETFEDEEYSVDYNAEYADSDALVWNLKTNARFLEINDTTGLLTGTPQQEDVGSYYVNVTVSDDELFDYHNFTLTVLGVNERPTITTTDKTQALEDEEYTVQYGADDEEGDTITWYLDTNTTFLTITPTTGKLSGTPKQKDVGTFWVNVTISDGELIDYHNFSLEVINVNDIPTVSITSPTNGSEVKGTSTIKGTASDEDGTIEKVEISINGGDWLVVTGIDSWSYEWNSTMVKNGSYEINVRAFDGEDYSPELAWELTVKNEEDAGKPDENGEEEGAGFLPGFGVVCLLAGILAGSLRQGRKKKRSIPSSEKSCP